MITRSFWITKSLTPSRRGRPQTPRLLASSMSFFRSLPRNLTTAGSGTRGTLTGKQRVGSDAQNRQSNSLPLFLPLPDTPELFCLDHRSPLMEQPAIYPGENNVLRNGAAALAWQWSLKLMYFSLTEMQIYAPKVLQNLIRSFTIEECATCF